MNRIQIANLKEFLNRTDLKGREVPAFNDIIKELDNELNKKDEHKSRRTSSNK